MENLWFSIDQFRADDLGTSPICVLVTSINFTGFASKICAEAIFGEN